jgi:hypothetical protein
MLIVESGLYAFLLGNIQFENVLIPCSCSLIPCTTHTHVSQIVITVEGLIKTTSSDVMRYKQYIINIPTE